MRVLTFQSKEVINTILVEGRYYANIEKCRERNDYSKDINTLNGKVPIWIFIPVDKNNKYTLKEKFEEIDFKDGELLDRFRCEMSTNYLTDFHLLELEVSNELIHKGITRNDFEAAKIISHIDINMLCAIYTVEPTSYSYYPKVKVYRRYRKSILFPEGLTCMQYYKNKWVEVSIKDVIFQVKNTVRIKPYGEDEHVIESNINYIGKATFAGKSVQNIRYDIPNLNISKFLDIENISIVKSKK